MAPIDSILKQYDPSIQQLAMQLRAFLLQELDGVQEMPDLSANIIGYGYGKGYKDMICTIIPSKKGIKLGFNRGIELPDPQGLLKGTGKLHKYVEILSHDVMDQPALKNLLYEAVDAYAQRKQSKK